MTILMVGVAMTKSMVVLVTIHYSVALETMHCLVALVMISWCRMAVVARPMMAVKAPIHIKLISVYSV